MGLFSFSNYKKSLVDITNEVCPHGELHVPQHQLPLKNDQSYFNPFLTQSTNSQQKGLPMPYGIAPISPKPLKNIGASSEFLRPN